MCKCLVSCSLQGEHPTAAPNEAQPAKAWLCCQYSCSVSAGSWCFLTTPPASPMPATIGTCGIASCELRARSSYAGTPLQRLRCPRQRGQQLIPQQGLHGCWMSGGCAEPRGLDWAKASPQPYRGSQGMSGLRWAQLSFAHSYPGVLSCKTHQVVAATAVVAAALVHASAASPA